MWWGNCRYPWVWVKTAAVSIVYRKWVYTYCSDKIVQWAVIEDDSRNSLYWGFSRGGRIWNASSGRSTFVFHICNPKREKAKVSEFYWFGFLVLSNEDSYYVSQGWYEKAHLQAIYTFKKHSSVKSLLQATKTDSGFIHQKKSV